MSSGYDYKKFAVLYVDDEAQALKYFAQAYEDFFRIYTAGSVDEALRILAEHGDEIGVVITDQRMPQKTGVDLLGALRKSRPTIIRILTTAYSDLQSAITAVNDGAIYKYIVKPWDLHDLRVVLMRAMEFFIVQKERDLLFREKLSVLQRMVLTDRVKSLSVLAASLSNRLRNSMSALQQYLEQTPDALQQELEGRMARNPDHWNDLWGVAKLETESVLKMVHRLASVIDQPHYTFADEIDLEELIRDAAGSVERLGDSGSVDVAMDLATDLPMFKVDRELLQKMLKILIEQTVANTPQGSRLLISAADRVTVMGTPGLRILISGEGPAWEDGRVANMFSAFGAPGDEAPDLGLDLLHAFFIAYHHGGELSIKQQAPDGPGFEVRLPFAPSAADRPTLEQNLMEKLLLRFDLWSQP